MAPDDVPHRSAVLVAFVVADHARLAAMDGTGTARRVAAIRSEIIDPDIAVHGGRLVAQAEDGLVAAFPTADGAIRHALDVLDAVRRRNKDVAEGWRIELRVGIAPAAGGDDDGRLARRLAALAASGGVCISRAVRDAASGDGTGRFLDIGEQYLDETDTPVEVFRVVPLHAGDAARTAPSRRSLWNRRRRAAAALIAVLAVAGLVWWQGGAFHVEPASPARMAYKLPDKPSVAVLPFEDLSPQAADGAFAAGVTADIAGRLAQISGLFVIGSGSTAGLPGTPADLPRAAEALGVRYILHGGIARAGDGLHVEARLTDAMGAKLVWEGRYDGAAADIFAARDDIALNVALNLAADLTQPDLERLSRSAAPVFAAYDEMLRGRALLAGPAKDLAAAQLAFETAISLDPEYSGAHAALSAVHADAYVQADGGSRQADLAMALGFAERAVALDPGLPAAHAAAARAYLYARRHGEALREIRDAAALAPGDAAFKARLGWILGAAGSPERGLAPLEAARRLSPGDPGIPGLLGATLRASGRLDAAVAVLEEHRARRGGRVVPEAELALAAAYMQTGREADARETVRKVLAAAPHLTTGSAARATPYRRPDVLAAMLDALSLAGLPDDDAPPLAERRTLAVLPFASLTRGGRQDYFSYGVTDGIERDLSKVVGLVIAGLAETGRYGERPVDPLLVLRELGVGFILFGSVSRRAHRLRVFAQLIASDTSNTIWQETYDRDVADLFDVQADVVEQVMLNLAVRPTRAERGRLEQAYRPPVAAYDAYLRGRAKLAHPTRANLDAAEDSFDEAIRLDPGFAGPYAGLASIYGFRAGLDGKRVAAPDLVVALGLARRAVALDPESAGARASLAFAHVLGRQYDQALAAIGDAVALAPGDVELRRRLGRYLTFAGRPEEGIVHLRMAHRMAPYSATGPLLLGEAYRAAGRYREAVDIFEAYRRSHDAPPDPEAALQLAASYAELGRDAEARAEVAAMRDAAPHVTLGFLAPRLPYRREEDRRAFLDALRRGGLR